MSKLAKILRALPVPAAVLLIASRSFAADDAKPKARVIELSVTEKGWEPTPIKVKKGEPLDLVITRKTDHTCAKEIVIDEGKIETELPLNKAVYVAFTPAKAGTIKYSCSMGKMV